MSAEKIGSSISIPAPQVHASLRKHMLVDGFPFVLDLEKSHGSWLYDEATGKKYLDFFTFFASSPIGLNHPALLEEDYLRRVGRVAANNVSNSDLYTKVMAEFVETFAVLAAPPALRNFFFISGGALAVENGLKAAFDWKVRKNFARGAKKETGHKVIHFRDAFHGRTGYTMSMTNTDPTKTDYFPKFDWPRIENPRIVFPLERHLEQVIEAEKRAVAAIEKALAEDGDDIAALIIEPIQGEGGDNHFRPEFFRELRRIADENEIMLVYDEVQTGVGITGKMWAHQNFGVEPDILCFGKKTQVCGIMANDRVNEVDSVFKIPSRINSTWGGNIVDMLRATRIFEVIEKEKLVDNAARMGLLLREKLQDFERRYDGFVTNARGLGLFCAFDLPDTACRDAFITTAIKMGLISLKCGKRTVRFRPPLSVTADDIEQGAMILDQALSASAKPECRGDTSGAVKTE